MSSWENLEAEVRKLAGIIWGGVFRSQMVHDRQIDAYCEDVRGVSVAIEVTEEKSINKIQDDLNKLIHVRTANSFNGGIYRQTECYAVTSFLPTPAMLGACSKLGVKLLTIKEFREFFLPFERYSENRLLRPFGSAVDAQTGEPDGLSYVDVNFIQDSALVSNKFIIESLR